MLSCSECFPLYIRHILNFANVEVVDYLSSMLISTFVTANVAVFSSSFDDSHVDQGESILIVTVDLQQL